MTQTLHLNVLGRFEALRSDGEPVTLVSKKAQALLAFLAVESRHPQQREKLATLLWSDTGDERARHNLRQALSKIRSCCDSLVVSHGDALELNQADCVVDVIEFKRLANSDNPDELQQCLELYRGDLLDGVIPREPVFDEWLLVSRSRLRKIACDAADRLVGLLIDQDRKQDAIKVLEHKLEMDPASETSHRQLMDIFATTGRRSDALRQYQLCAEVLKRELGALPSAETKAFYESLCQADINQEVKTASPAPTAAESKKYDRPTVAVLPFENLSGPDCDYFVDGIAEDLITALSRFQSLLVISRGSSFAYRDRNVPDKQISEELGAQFLVRGSIRRAGQRIRINVQLLDADDGLNLWGEQFDGELEDVFLVQDEITSTVVSTLAGRVEAARLSDARRAPADRLEAYDYLLRGKDHHHRYTPEDCSACIDMFEHAIERDPNYAVAYAWLACGLGQAMVFNLDDGHALVNRAQKAAERGLELDEDDSECHRVLAQVCLERHDVKQALWHQERALFLNPNDDRSVCAMGEILTVTGRHEEAADYVRKAMRLNPYHPPRYWTHLARPLFHLERYQESISALEKIPSPRKDDLAYGVAVNFRLGDAKATERSVIALRKAFPDFEAAKFLDSLGLQRDEDRQALLDALAPLAAA